MNHGNVACKYLTGKHSSICNIPSADIPAVFGVPVITATVPVYAIEVIPSIIRMPEAGYIPGIISIPAAFTVSYATAILATAERRPVRTV
jgi:hypothetical protein